MSDRSNAASRILVRVGLLLGALAALWFAERRGGLYRNGPAPSDWAIVGRWAATTGLGLLSGALAGLAVFLPDKWQGYRPWPAPILLAAVPLALLLYTLIVGSLLGGVQLPSTPFLGTRLLPLFADGPQMALAVIAGVALSAGFVRRTS